VPGWCVLRRAGTEADDDTDIMGYCSNQWIADYVYQSVLSFRAAQGNDFWRSGGM